MDKLNKLLFILVAIALGIMTIVVFYQVLVRFALSSFFREISAPWTEELARYLMIWSIFIGGAVASRKAKLIAVEALVHAIPALPGKAIKISAHLLSIVFYIWIFLIGLDWAKFGLSETAPVMGFSMVYIFSALSVGAVLMFLNTVALLVEVFVNKTDIRDASLDHEAEDIRKQMEGA